MSDQKCFTGTIVARRDVTVFADSPEEAEAAIRKMHGSGDACATLDEVEFVDFRETNVQGHELLDVYLFFDDETATMMDTPILQVPANTEELTDEMVREILIDCLGHSEENEQYLPLVAGWDRDKMADAMWSLCTLILNKAALVPQKHRDTIGKIGEALDDLFGSDSSTYSACASFGRALEGFATRVIPFPMPDLDEGDKRDYTV